MLKTALKSLIEVAGVAAPALAQEDPGRAGPAGSAVVGVDDIKSLAERASGMGKGVRELKIGFRIRFSTVFVRF